MLIWVEFLLALLWKEMNFFLSLCLVQCQVVVVVVFSFVVGIWRACF